MASLWSASWRMLKARINHEKAIFDKCIKNENKVDAFRVYRDIETMFEQNEFLLNGASFFGKIQFKRFRKKLVITILNSLCKKGWLSIEKELIDDVVENPSDILAYIEKELAETYEALSKADDEKLNQLEEAFNFEKNKLQNLDITLKEKYEIEQKIVEIAQEICTLAYSKQRVWEAELKEGERSQNMTIKRQKELQTKITKLNERIEPFELIVKRH
jgi:Mg2+ and Co2+ transporter CorA